MRLTRPRITVRRLMIAVAVAGVGLGLIARRERFRRVADHHHRKVMDGIDTSCNWYSSTAADDDAIRLDWHESMMLRYNFAADHPWLPLGVDPPEPSPTR